MATAKKAAPAAAPVKKKAASTEGFLTAYNVKTKEKGVPIQDCVVNCKSGKFVAQGTSATGEKLSAIVSLQKAEEAIAAETASKGEGWPAPAKKAK